MRAHPTEGVMGAYIYLFVSTSSFGLFFAAGYKGAYPFSVQTSAFKNNRGKISSPCMIHFHFLLHHGSPKIMYNCFPGTDAVTIFIKKFFLFRKAVIFASL
jgi:hypothetical protein